MERIEKKLSIYERIDPLISTGSKTELIVVKGFEWGRESIGGPGNE